MQNYFSYLCQNYTLRQLFNWLYAYNVLENFDKYISISETHPMYSWHVCFVNINNAWYISIEQTYEHAGKEVVIFAWLLES